MNPLLAAAESTGHFVSFDVPVWVWAAFAALVAGLLIADLLLVHRTAHVITLKAVSYTHLTLPTILLV